MRIRLVLGLVAIAVALGMSHGVCVAQPECTNVHFSLYDPEDPPCGYGGTIDTKWSIHVTSSPSSISAGTCFTFPLNYLYTDVDFYSGDEVGDCAETFEFTCDIVASGSSLSGYYPISSVNGACITVCETCTP